MSAFWKAMRKIARQNKKLPAWMKAGINLSKQHYEIPKRIC